MPLRFPSATLSNGKRRLHIAVTTKIAAEDSTGKLGVRVRRKPAVTGAMTPVLTFSSYPRTRVAHATYNLLNAADVPQAVPRMLVPNVSGVIPSMYEHSHSSTRLLGFPCPRSHVTKDALSSRHTAASCRLAIPQALDKKVKEIKPISRLTKHRIHRRRGHRDHHRARHHRPLGLHVNERKG